jgi:hypothetical protein
MRPKIFMWSDYGASTQKHWRSPSRRSTRSSIGPKILVVAGGVVAGVIGISGIYPEIIDADWVQSAGTDSPHSKNVAISDATTTRMATTPPVMTLAFSICGMACETSSAIESCR